MLLAYFQAQWQPFAFVELQTNSSSYCSLDLPAVTLPFPIVLFLCPVATITRANLTILANARTA